MIYVSIKNPIFAVKNKEKYLLIQIKNIFIYEKAIIYYCIVGTCFGI